MSSTVAEDGESPLRASDPAAPARAARPTIFELAWPSITASVLHSVVGIVDMIIVGQVSVDAQAAVGSGHRVVFMGQAAMMAVTAGTTALVARAWGAENPREAERITFVSLVACSALSLVLGGVGVLLAEPLAASFGLPATTTARTAEFIRWLSAFHLGFTLQFVLGVALRATGDVLTPLLIGALTNVLNVVLVYALVFGELPGLALPIDPMGVRGAAIASGLAFSAGSILLVALYLTGRLNLAPRVAGALTRERLRRLWKIGYPSGLEQAVKLQTLDTAHLVGLRDRGALQVGMRADLNVIDPERIELRRPEMVYDLPGGARRLLQRADGYCSTLVAGEVVMQEGEPTGARPGRLIRGAQLRPSA